MARPNIVFIMADDMGFGDATCYNPDSKIPTPHIDALAAEGVRFTDAHSPSAVCTPTRYGVLTGRYCWRSRLKEGVTGGYDSPLIERSRLTIASMLRQQGYATACIGKWHVGLTFQDADGNPTTREDSVDFTKPVLDGPAALGFEYAWYNAACGTMSPPYGFIQNDRFVDTSFSYFDGGPHGQFGSSGMMGADWKTIDADVVIARKAREYIEGRSTDDRPFFLYLTPNAPHEPCVRELVPEFARDKSAAGARGDLVWLFDWIVGEVVDALDGAGLADNTLLIVTSDNGALPGDFLLEDDGRRVAKPDRNFVFRDYGHRSCGALRGHKAHIWEGGHREPLVVRWPGTIAPGTVTGEMVCLTDIMATCAAITGYELPDDAAEDSFDITSALRASGSPVRDAAVHHSSFGVFSIRQDTWKLILDTKTSGGWPTPRGEHPKPGTPGQLYDIAADPAEEHDLWEEKPEVVEELTRRLEGYKQNGRSTPHRS
jgi:arylsulfatase A-like enzyme